jgi:Domain of unknown function (DUF6468)
MDGAQVLLEGALVLLLGATLFHAIRLERALGVLKRDRAVLEGLVTGFNDSTRQAEEGVAHLQEATEGAGRAIARQIEQAQRLRDDLTFLSERGERLAERLESGVRASRMAADQAAMAGQSSNFGLPGLHAVPVGFVAEAEPAAGARLRSEAERDLQRALRAAR